MFVVIVRFCLWPWREARNNLNKNYFLGLSRFGLVKRQFLLLEAPRGQGGLDLFVAPSISLRAPMGSRPLEFLEMPVFCSFCARHHVPGAPVGPRPLEDLNMPVLGSCRKRFPVPGAPVSPRPLKDLEEPVCCSHVFSF